MSVFKFLLLPFAMLYDVITSLRNKLYDLKFKASASFDIPVISVGNLVMGGSGKTPMVEHLIRILQSHYKITTLSRGYGRKTKGFRIAGHNDSAATVGDEPLQIYRKFSDSVHVVVCEDRALAIPLLLQEFPETQIVILDDAFQHRRVVPGLSILLSEYGRPFYDDNVLPYGRLREGPEGAARADMIVITKCPAHLEEEEMMRMENRIRKFSSKPVFFSKIRYIDPVGFGDGSKKITRDVVLLSAIANSQLFEEDVRKSYTIKKHFSFRDHYEYTISDVKAVETFLENHQNEQLSILTTEKDKVKLTREELKPYISRLPIFYLPIETEFLRNGKDFDMLVMSFINSFKPA
jgi:tetraacyldisaccharide 4'-kinase